MTVSLPPTLIRQFEEVRKKESRTRSELVREALRVYFESRYPAVPPTKAELTALRRGRAAFDRGDALPLKKFLHDVEPPHHHSSTKGISKTSAKRPSSY
jgi:Arc/MetJ-type ribon-helix-helix transcriptional regulator